MQQSADHRYCLAQTAVRADARCRYIAEIFIYRCATLCVIKNIFYPQMSSRDDPEKSYNVPLPDNNYVTVYLRDSMTNEEFLASACVRKNLNPMEHFVRVKKRRDMEDHNYFVPHRNDLIETYVSDSF